MNITQFLTDLFGSLQERGVRYAVLRNYESLPDTLDSRDIDILIEPSACQTVLDILGSMSGVLVSHVYRRKNSMMVFVWNVEREGGVRSLEIDLIFDFRWRGVRYFDSNRILSRAITQKTGSAPVQIPHPVDAAALQALSTLISYGTIPEKYRAELSETFLGAVDDVNETLKMFVGPEAGMVEERVRSGRPTLDKPSRRRLVAAARRRSGESLPQVLAGGLAQVSYDSLAAWISPPRVAFAFLGPDGVGKSTVIDHVSAAVRGLSVSQSIRHLRMKVWVMGKRVSKRGVVTEPHALPLRGRAASLAKIMGWIAGERLYWLLWRPRNPTLMILDRYFDDILADSRRYRINLPAAVARLGTWLVPRPSLVFVLMAPADVILSRKQEVSREELDLMLERYKAISHRRTRMVPIDCNRDVKDIVEEVTGHMLTEARRSLAR